jgi:hypothetical protein
VSYQQSQRFIRVLTDHLGVGVWSVDFDPGRFRAQIKQSVDPPVHSGGRGGEDIWVIRRRMMMMMMMMMMMWLKLCKLLLRVADRAQHPNRSISRSINQSVNQSISQSVNLSIYHMQRGDSLPWWPQYPLAVQSRNQPVIKLRTMHDPSSPGNKLTATATSISLRLANKKHRKQDKLSPLDA